MSLSVGHVLIIDNDYKLLTRLWCLYDIHLAITRKVNGYKIDFYAAIISNLQSTVVRITDGFISSDLKHGADECFDLKMRRESQFPIDFFTKVLQINVKTAEANSPMDYKFIRNIICNQQHNATPPEIHEKYDTFNNVVAGFFFAASLERLLGEFFKTDSLLSHDQLRSYLKILKESLSTDISCVLSESNKDLTDYLFSSFPSSLQTLYVKVESENDLSKLSERIPNFIKMRELTINGAKLSPSSIKNICECFDKNSKMKLQKLSLINCDLKNEAFTALFTALNSNKNLKELDLSANNLLFDFVPEEDMKKTIEILKETAITKMNLTKNKLECPYFLLNLNKRFRSMKVIADTYQTPKVRNIIFLFVHFSHYHFSFNM
jgi:spore coat protein CotF